LQARFKWKIRVVDYTPYQLLCSTKFSIQLHENDLDTYFYQVFRRLYWLKAIWSLWNLLPQGNLQDPHTAYKRLKRFFQNPLNRRFDIQKRFPLSKAFKATNFSSTMSLIRRRNKKNTFEKVVQNTSIRIYRGPLRM
jgi:hypothetical protein